MARLGAWLNGLLSPAEDPRSTFASAIARQQTMQGEVRRALVDIAAAKVRLQTYMGRLRPKLPELDSQTRRAIQAGRDDLARLLIRRSQLAEAELTAIESQLRDVETEEGRLILTEQKLAAQIEAFYARQQAIGARYGAAEAQVRINEALGGVSRELSDLDLALKNAEEKAETMQVRATALDLLIDEGVLQAPAPLSDRSGEVEAALQRLKREIGGANAQGVL
jgi:phage shock protein A